MDDPNSEYVLNYSFEWYHLIVLFITLNVVGKLKSPSATVTQRIMWGIVGFLILGSGFGTHIVWGGCALIIIFFAIGGRDR